MKTKRRMNALLVPVLVAAMLWPTAGQTAEQKMHDALAPTSAFLASDDKPAHDAHALRQYQNLLSMMGRLMDHIVNTPNPIIKVEDTQTLIRLLKEMGSDRTAAQIFEASCNTVAFMPEGRTKNNLRMSLAHTAIYLGNYAKALEIAGTIPSESPSSEDARLIEVEAVAKRGGTDIELLYDKFSNFKKPISKVQAGLHILAHYRNAGKVADARLLWTGLKEGLSTVSDTREKRDLFVEYMRTFSGDFSPLAEEALVLMQYLERTIENATDRAEVAVFYHRMGRPNDTARMERVLLADLEKAKDMDQKLSLLVALADIAWKTDRKELAVKRYEEAKLVAEISNTQGTTRPFHPMIGKEMEGLIKLSALMGKEDQTKDLVGNAIKQWRSGVSEFTKTMMGEASVSVLASAGQLDIALDLVEEIKTPEVVSQALKKTAAWISQVSNRMERNKDLLATLLTKIETEGPEDFPMVRAAGLVFPEEAVLEFSSDKDFSNKLRARLLMGKNLFGAVDHRSFVIAKESLEEAEKLKQFEAYSHWMATLSEFGKLTSIDSLNYLENRAEKTIGRKARREGGKVHWDSFDRTLIAGLAKTDVQRGLVPAVSCETLSISDREFVLKLLVDGKTLDKSLLDLYKKMHADSAKESFFEVIAQLHQEFPHIPPTGLLVQHLLNGTLTVEDLKKFQQDYSGKPFDTMVTALAADQKRALAYFILQQSDLRYSSIFSFDTFWQVLKAAGGGGANAKRLQDFFSLIAKRQKDKAPVAGILKQIMQKLISGDVPLPDGSPLLDAQGEFVRRVDLAQEAGKELERSRRAYREHFGELVQVIKADFFLAQAQSLLSKPDLPFTVEKPKIVWDLELEQITRKVGGIYDLPEAMEGLIQMYSGLAALDGSQRNLEEEWEIFTKRLQKKFAQTSLPAVLGLTKKKNLEEMAFPDLKPDVDAFYRSYDNMLVQRKVKKTKIMKKPEEGKQISLEEEAFLKRPDKPNRQQLLAELLEDCRSELGLKAPWLGSVYPEILGHFQVAHDLYVNNIGEKKLPILRESFAYVRYIPKKDLIMFMRLADGAPCCISALAKDPTFFANMPGYMRDYATMAFLVHSQQVVGFVLCQLGMDADGRPGLISNRLYLKSGYQSDASVTNIWSQVESFAQHMFLEFVDQTSTGSTLARNPPADYRTGRRTLRRVQAAEGSELYNDHRVESKNYTTTEMSSKTLAPVDQTALIAALPRVPAQVLAADASAAQEHPLLLPGIVFEDDVRLPGPKPVEELQRVFREQPPVNPMLPPEQRILDLPAHVQDYLLDMWHRILQARGVNDAEAQHAMANIERLVRAVDGPIPTWSFNIINIETGHSVEIRTNDYEQLAQAREARLAMLATDAAQVPSLEEVDGGVPHAPDHEELMLRLPRQPAGPPQLGDILGVDWSRRMKRGEWLLLKHPLAMPYWNIHVTQADLGTRIRAAIDQTDAEYSGLLGRWIKLLAWVEQCENPWKDEPPVDIQQPIGPEKLRAKIMALYPKKMTEDEVVERELMLIALDVSQWYRLRPPAQPLEISEAAVSVAL